MQNTKTKPRAQRTEQRAQCPEPRAQSTEHIAQCPEPRAQSAETRAQRAEHRAHTIVTRYQSREHHWCSVKRHQFPLPILKPRDLLPCSCLRFYSFIYLFLTRRT